MTYCTSSARTETLNATLSQSWRYRYCSTRGTWSGDWSLLQDEFYANQLNTKPKQKRTGHTWQEAIIWSVWSRWYLVWELRNHDLHRADEPSRAKANCEEVERAHWEKSMMRRHRWNQVCKHYCANSIVQRTSHPIFQEQLDIIEIGWQYMAHWFVPTSDAAQKKGRFKMWGRTRIGYGRNLQLDSTSTWQLDAICTR